MNGRESIVQKQEKNITQRYAQIFHVLMMGIDGKGLNNRFGGAYFCIMRDAFDAERLVALQKIADCESWLG